MRTSMTTNLNVIQSSVFMKFRPLFAFLQRQAAPVALEVQRAYIAAVRTYLETGFRRYIRSLGWIKVQSMDRTPPNSLMNLLSIQTRTTENTDLIVTAAGEGSEPEVDVERLSYARIDGPGPVLAYMAEEKTHVSPSFTHGPRSGLNEFRKSLSKRCFVRCF